MKTAAPDRRRRAFQWLLLATLVGFGTEIATALFFLLAMPQGELIRAGLRGEQTGFSASTKVSGQPYLSLVATPNYANHFGPQHNAQGFRGEPVPLRRVPGVGRVVCFGASTTYGWCVATPQEAWPHKLRLWLRSHPVAGLRDYEVINAGVPSATSAELLAHYHFKYRYWRPDLVIINAGGNDAIAMKRRTYQPDYSTVRAPLTALEPLPRQSRWLLHSRFASLLIIGLFEAQFLRDESFERPKDYVPPAAWYPELDRAQATTPVPEAELAFEHNVRALVREARRDGCQVLLVPFRLSPTKGRGVEFVAELDRNISLLKQLAVEEQVGWAPFPASLIPAEDWFDWCHLLEPGELRKAAHIGPYAAALLAAPGAKQDDSTAGRKHP